MVRVPPSKEETAGVTAGPVAANTLESGLAV